MGNRRIGVAVSDELGLTAQPVMTLERKPNPRDDLRSLARLARRYAVSAIVVGNPLRLSGENGPQAQKTQAFAAEFGALTGLPIHLWDERLTTQEAHRILYQAGHKRQEHRRLVDQVAATLILQSFLDEKLGASRDQPPPPLPYNCLSGVIKLRGLSSLARSGHRMPEHIKKKLLDEIKALEYELAHELPAEIKKARALGDLSENAEYHMAKQRQEFVNARLGQLKKRMGELSLVNLTNIPRDKAGFGSTVVVYDSTKEEELVYRLVTSEEADVTKGLISTTSPIGRGIVGKKVGDVAVIHTPNGKRELEILKLTTIHDEAGDEGEEDEAAAAGAAQ